MTENTSHEQRKRGLSKRTIIVSIILLIIVIGGVAAYTALKSSDKTQYFLAEKATLDYIGEELGERFEPELAWQEYVKTNAIANTTELSGEYNEPDNEFTNDLFSLDQIINNSSITLKTEQDISNKKLSAELITNLAGMEFDDFTLYLTDEKIMLGLPFLSELWLVENKDVNKLMSEIDPELGEVDFDLADLFNTENQFLTKEDIEYFQKEYLTMIFKEFSEDSFSSTDENVEIAGDSLKTKKITMTLNEDELKNLMTNLVDKASKDERIKDILRNQLTATAVLDADATEIISDFESDLALLKEDIGNLYIPEGLSSTIWINKKLIVKRELNFAYGTSEADVMTVSMNGEQLLEDKKQVFTYDFSYSDVYGPVEFSVVGDLAWDGDTITDSIELLVEDSVISYEADETLNKGTRDFNRVVSVSDPYDAIGLVWSGEANYEKDAMRSEHEFVVEMDDLGEYMVSGYLTFDGKRIKDVEIPEEENVKNIGQMSDAELNNYFETDVALQFQDWLFGLFSGGGFGF